LDSSVKINKLLENRYPTHFWISIKSPLYRRDLKGT
jgi:hypothetical protein